MTDQEKNEAVARRMGWTICEDDDDGDWHSPGDEHGIGVCTNTLPDYCHSIEAAWEIANWCKEKMNGSFHWDFILKRSDRSWSCEMFGYDPVEADTAPMAIVEAFLKLP